jgi:hypothetical protein
MKKIPSIPQKNPHHQQVVAKMGATGPQLVFPTWGAQPLASEDAAQRGAGAAQERGD